MQSLADPTLYEVGVPYEQFARLRKDDPVHWTTESDGPGFWSVLRFNDIVEVSRQPKLFSSAYEWGGHRIFNENEVGLAGAGDAEFGVPMISRDPPAHTRYRKVIMPALAPSRIVGLEDRIRERVQALVDAVPKDQPVDIVDLLSAPVPLLTLAELLGAPPEMCPKLFEWTNAFIGEDDPEFRQSPESMNATLTEFFAYCKDLFHDRRTNPNGDLLSKLANTEIDGRPLTVNDFLANLVLLTVGGNETIRNTTSHAIIQFAEHPEQWAHVRANPSILGLGVKEMVRHASPVLHMRRTATEDTEIAGTKIAKGDKVVMWYPSGNRDETAIQDPEAFDVTRSEVPNVGFGTGQHICAGSRIAEMQLRIVFETLAKSVTRLEVTKPPRRLRSNFISGIKELPVILHTH